MIKVSLFAITKHTSRIRTPIICINRNNDWLFFKSCLQGTHSGTNLFDTVRMELTSVRFTLLINSFIRIIGFLFHSLFNCIFNSDISPTSVTSIISFRAIYQLLLGKSDSFIMKNFKIAFHRSCSTKSPT